MKILLFSCAIALFAAVANLPIGYYTFLRIFVTIGAIAVVVTEYEEGLGFWVILFGIIGIVFNPVIPVYLYDKGVWAVIDLVSAALFVIKAFLVNKTYNHTPD